MVNPRSIGKGTPCSVSGSLSRHHALLQNLGVLLFHQLLVSLTCHNQHVSHVHCERTSAFVEVLQSCYDMTIMGK